MLKKLWIVLLLVSCFAVSAFASSLTLLPPIQAAIPRTKPLQIKNRLSQVARPTHQVTMMRVSLSPSAKAALKARLKIAESASRSLPKAYIGSLPRQVQLGMNNVPVLDQGSHGTCVLFATTGALDAAIGRGDYISQLCELELGNYLQNNSYVLSGWDGSFGKLVASQLDMFGIVPKSIEANGGCGGVIDYPVLGEALPNELSVFDFLQLSEPLQAYGLKIEPLMLPEQISASFQDQDRLLQQIKKLLTQGDRITFGMFLMGYDQGVLGALGTHNVANDTWVMTPEMLDQFSDEDEFGLHELIITGYDDDAVATDPSGRMSRGLLTLRNSWGEQVGDQGNFYVSYNYFKAFLMEAQHIRQNRV